MALFDVDFQKVAYNLTPHFLRSTNILSWMNALVKPIRELNLSFLSFEDNITYTLQFTGQVIYLERILNDLFDPVGRNIFIDDTSNIDYDFLFQKVEQNTDIFIFNNSQATPFFFQNRVEFETFIHFIVKIPVAVSFNEDAVRAIVDRRKQAGKNYSIETF